MDIGRGEKARSAEKIVFPGRSVIGNFSGGASTSPRQQGSSARTVTWIGLSGRNVIDAFGFTVWPGTISNRQRRKISVSTIPSSIQAKPSPMQDLGPPPNGKKAYFGKVR